MIIYNLKTKQKRSMFVDDYIKWMKKHGDTIRVLPIRRDGFSPVIEVYRDKSYVDAHAVQMSASEAEAINNILPPQRKDGYFNLNRMKV